MCYLVLEKCGASCPWEVVRPDGPAQVAPIWGRLFALLPQLLGPRTHGPHKRPARASRVWGVWGAWARQLRKGAKSPPRAVPDFGCEPPIDQWWPGRGWKGGRVAGCWGRKVGRIFHLVPNPPTGIGAFCWMRSMRPCPKEHCVPPMGTTERRKTRLTVQPQAGRSRPRSETGRTNYQVVE